MKEIMNNKNLGILYIILGSAIVVLFAGHLLIRFLGAIFGLFILNHGLQLLRFAPVQILAFQIFEDIKNGVKKRK
ncbi:MAG: hypothetical protein P4L22_01765 [Candidatus Babeliales bacterium]|nr:hypothetical protein [Candidatus Babeliales bacterium]